MRQLLVCVAVMSAACAGNLPEPGLEKRSVGRAIPEDDPPPPAAGDGVAEALQASLRANKTCDAVMLSIPKQQTWVSNVAYNRKQGGLALTTAVGVAGSIVTAVLASEENAEAATIVGASTAGATSLAGVLSLFVIGTGADAELQRMSQNAKDIEARQSAHNSSCKTVAADNAASCTQSAELLKNYCAEVAAGLRYHVPGVTNGGGSGRDKQ